MLHNNVQQVGVHVQQAVACCWPAIIDTHANWGLLKLHSLSTAACHAGADLTSKTLKIVGVFHQDHFETHLGFRVMVNRRCLKRGTESWHDTP